MRVTRDFLFVDLRKKLNSLTSRFRQVSSRHVETDYTLYKVKVHDETKSRIICLAKNERHLESSHKLPVSYEKDTTKDLKKMVHLRTLFGSFLSCGEHPFT